MLAKKVGFIPFAQNFDEEWSSRKYPYQLQGRSLEISRRRGGGGGGGWCSKAEVVICEAEPEWGYYKGYNKKPMWERFGCMCLLEQHNFNS